MPVQRFGRAAARSFSCLFASQPACLPARSRCIRSFVRYALLGRVSEPLAFQRCFNKLEYIRMGFHCAPRRFNCLNRIGEYKNFILDLSSILSLSLDDNYQLLPSEPTVFYTLFFCFFFFSISISVLHNIQTPSYLSAAATAADAAWPIFRLHRNRVKMRFC